VKSNETDISLATLSADSSVYIGFVIDEILKDNDWVYFQCAYLYTSKSGVRVIRIHNLKLSTSAAIAKIYKGADLDSVLNVLARKAIANIINDTLQTVRAKLLKQIIDILAAYRLHSARCNVDINQKEQNGNKSFQIHETTATSTKF